MNAPGEIEATKWIGRSVERLEDPPLVTGRGRYAADIAFPHQLHMRVVRSNQAHGKIVSIDTAAARALPGVVAVWTAADIADVPPVDFREGRIERLEPWRQPVLATERVRYVGDPVAAVFAEDPYVAEDAADLVTMEIDELPALLDATAELGEFSAGRTSEPTVLKQGYGDVDAAMRDAHAVVELTLSVGRHSGVPLETRGAIGRYDASRDMLELHGAAKVPHRNRDLLARMLKRSPSSVSVHEAHVGGGFGIRGELYPEDVLVCVAALRLGRPVKWIEDRREHLICANHSRQQTHKIRAAVDHDGRLLAIDDEFWHDQGAYIRTHATRVAMMICGILPGPYRVGAYRSVGHFRLTNKTPAATYRAPGRYETTFIRERLIEAIARRLNLDPIAVRRKNLIAKTDMPYHLPLEVLGEEIHMDTGDYASLLDKMLAAADWDDLQATLAQRRANGELVGAGLAMFIEKSGLGPSDGVRISVDTSGFVEVVTGGASIGQGFETVMAQVAAEVLGVDYRAIRVIHGQTDRIAYGIGAHASRATVMTASATHNAAVKLRAKALEYAAGMLQAPVEALAIVDGRVVRTDGGAGASISASMSLGEIAEGLAPTSKTRGGREPGLSAEGWFDTKHQVYPYGTHIAVVRVDRETGGVAIERYIAGYDIGRAINPILVKGQITGGFTQGLGGALYEEFVYSERGDPLSASFADYIMPTARETPAIEILLTEEAPTPLNPLGIKGAGESGITAVGAVIASAVEAAIGKPGAITALPITPQRLRRIIDGK
ncbi:MAG TPA: xanthine dehydrogenase family protein molybdopterin-binding subunit [Xanthobacteraceae bacterium]|nr:xanthine dehydrogenase family protein molybdopterin-binding subunit [Xanthobacteraceae bacterium]